jgi:hypothetical protein
MALLVLKDLVILAKVLLETSSRIYLLRFLSQNFGTLPLVF